jgi:hypothetical protein
VALSISTEPSENPEAFVGRELGLPAFPSGVASKESPSYFSYFITISEYYLTRISLDLGQINSKTPLGLHQKRLPFRFAPKACSTFFAPHSKA